MTLPHTEVDPAVGGQGIGTALVAGVLDAARERGLTVLPYCSFIRHYIQQHPEDDRSRRGRRPAALRPGDRRPLTCAAPRAACLRSAGADVAAVVPPRPPALRPPRPARRRRRGRRRRRRRPGVRPRPAALAARPGRPAGSSCSTAWPPCRTSLDGALVLRSRRPGDASCPALVARGAGATACTSRADAGPYGRRRDAAVERALGDVPLVRTGSPYAVDPGPGHQGATAPRSRSSRRSPAPGARTAGGPRRRRPDARPVADRRRARTTPPPRRGDRRPAAAGRRGRRAGGLGSGSATSGCSATTRAATCPGTDGTSRLSPYLKYGCVHPRTLLADLAAAGPTARRAVRRYTDELAWREFYADVLWHRPETAHEAFDARMAAHGLRLRPATPTSGSPPGQRAAPATRSSTPGCGSCAARRGCTTGCG